MKKTLAQLNKMVEEANARGGSLYLRGLTSIPDGFNPTVGGSLDLSGLTARYTRLKDGDYAEGRYLYIL